MAESYGVPGQACSVASISASGGDTWGKFCDCMFIENVQEERYFLNGQEVVFPTIPGNPGATAAIKDQMVQQLAGKPGLSIKVVISPYKTPDWYKCQTKFCGNPAGGCANPTTGVKDPFNVAPGILAAPWTDLGAAARGIPKRDASIWYDVGKAINIDIAEYDALNLWQQYWQNPTYFHMLALKAGLFPGAAVFTTYLLAGQWVGILGPAIAEAESKGLRLDKAIWLPARDGWGKIGNLALKYVGKCGFGIPGACGVGVMVQQAAQDQIDSGEINKITNGALRAGVYFLAKHGDVLADRIYAALKNAGKLAADPSFFKWLETVFRSLSATPWDVLCDKTDKNCKRIAAEIKSFLILATRVSKMAFYIADGISNDKDVATIIDDAVYGLIGVRPSDLKAMVMQGTAQAKADAAGVVARAEQREGTTMENMAAMAQGLGQALQVLLKTLSDLNGKVGGSLNELIKEIKNTGDLFGPIISETQDSISTAAQIAKSGTPAGATVLTASGQAYKPPVQQQQQPRGQQPHAATAPKGGVVKQATPFLLAAGGLAVGGPVGAVIGGVIGLAMKPKTTTSSVSGFGAAPAPSRGVASSGGGTFPMLTRSSVLAPRQGIPLRRPIAPFTVAPLVVRAASGAVFTPSGPVATKPGSRSTMPSAPPSITRGSLFLPSSSGSDDSTPASVPATQQVQQVMPSGGGGGGGGADDFTPEAEPYDQGSDQGFTVGAGTTDQGADMQQVREAVSQSDFEPQQDDDDGSQVATASSADTATSPVASGVRIISGSQADKIAQVKPTSGGRWAALALGIGYFFFLRR